MIFGQKHIKNFKAIGHCLHPLGACPPHLHKSELGHLKLPSQLSFISWPRWRRWCIEQTRGHVSWSRIFQNTGPFGNAVRGSRLHNCLGGFRNISKNTWIWIIIKKASRKVCVHLTLPWNFRKAFIIHRWKGKCNRCTADCLTTKDPLNKAKIHYIAWPRYARGDSAREKFCLNKFCIQESYELLLGRFKENWQKFRT